MAAVSSSSEIMLFGVRVVVDPMRKCVSLNNLSDYEEKEEIPKIESDAIAASGYASANDAVHITASSGGNRERKRGTPWTENEHKRFLLGLQKVGKGDWKGISRNFVKSRTPTQVASHAQKYFLRRTNLNRRRRRSSLFDITTETVTEMVMEQDQIHDNSSLPENNIISGHQVVSMPTRTENTTPQQIFHPIDTSASLFHLVPVTVQANPAPLSLNLSLSSSFDINSRQSAFTMMPSFSDGDSNSSIIRVA